MTPRQPQPPERRPQTQTKLGATTLANKVFGIDLGTTYSCISYVDEFSQPVVVSNQDGDPTTPSAVMFNADGTFAVGKSAKNELGTSPERVVILVKRHMGDPDWRFALDGQEFTAPQVSSKILQALVEDARNNTGEAVEDVVITVPAYFGVAERNATRAAGEVAGLNVVDIINEPTAAAFTYGFAKADSSADETVLVYDLGGGTFDVTAMRVASGEIDVRATDGDHELGGDNWDQQLIDLVVQKFMADNPDADDPLFDPNAQGDLRLEVEGAKRRLSTTQTAKVRVTSGATSAMVEVSREEFETATKELVDQTITLTNKCIEAAKENGLSTLDRVLLVGGSSFMPMIAPRVEEATGLRPQLQDPNLAVAKGAALWGQKANITATIIDKLKEQGIDVSAEDLHTVPEQELQEATAAVAVDNGMTTESVKKVVETRATNVCSQGFGVRILENGAPVVFFMIHRNTTLPAEHGEQFYTVVDNQPELNVVVYEQGTPDEQPVVEVNKVIVDGTIGPIPSGHPQGTPVDVKFEMGNNGILMVTARHPAVPAPLVLQQTVGLGVTQEEVAAQKEQMDGFRRAA
jgi:molecular chaperone DnaK